MKMTKKKIEAHDFHKIPNSDRSRRAKRKRVIRVLSIF